jgi:hypothetical protein
MGADVPGFQTRGVDGYLGLAFDQLPSPGLLEHHRQESFELSLAQQALVGVTERGVVGDFLQPQGPTQRGPFFQQDHHPAIVGLEEILQDTAVRLIVE